MGRTRTAVLGLLLIAVALAVPEGATSELASQPASQAAGLLDVGGDHTCAVLTDASLRCWGFSGAGQLGYGNTSTVGDDEVPGAAGPVDLGAGRGAGAVSAGLAHTCVVLDDRGVRCWGFGADGQLGYAGTSTVGAEELPGSAGPVDLGEGRSATAISSGDHHTCALLDGGDVRCWGNGSDGRLGYGRLESIGDDESPSSAGPVDLGAGHTATAVSAGARHTCALLEDGSVRCWGFGSVGRLGYANTNSIGAAGDAPGAAGPVDLGPGAKAVAISAGRFHTCAVLDTGAVRCWGFNLDGQLGYGNTGTVGDDETPGSVAPVDLGPRRTAVAISAGEAHTCAVLDDGTVRCWGSGAQGRLGYGDARTIGDDETPGSLPPVSFGSARTAVAISAGRTHTCTRLDDATVRCWGSGASGRLGLCGRRDIGDDELPGSVGPVIVAAPGGAGSGCPAGGGRSGTAPAETAPAVSLAAALRAQAARLRGLRGCRARAARHAGRERRRARRLTDPERARAQLHIRRHARHLRRRCLKSYGRTPGRVTGLKAQGVSPTRVLLSFGAAGTDGDRSPAAHGYLVKQSRRPIRGARAFRRAQTLCGGSCRFPATIGIGSPLTLAVRDLQPHVTYYYAVAARDNVSRRLGRRSGAVRATTR